MHQFTTIIQRSRYTFHGRCFFERLFNYVENCQSQTNSRVIDINVAAMSSDSDNYSHQDSNYAQSNTFKIHVAKVGLPNSNKSFRDREDLESEREAKVIDSRASANPQNKNKIYLNE